jgi:hypothetical protein
MEDDVPVVTSTWWHVAILNNSKQVQSGTLLRNEQPIAFANAAC